LGRVMNKSVVQLRGTHSNRYGFCSGRAQAFHLRVAGTAKTHATVSLHAELRPLWNNNSLASSEVVFLYGWFSTLFITASQFMAHTFLPISSLKILSSLLPDSAVPLNDHESQLRIRNV